MSQAVIGVTTWRKRDSSGNNQFTLAEAYIRALTKAGACPVMLPLGLPEESLVKLLSLVDGVLFSGGGDIHPDYYHKERHPLVDGVDHDRDQVELYLFHAAIERGLPFLGICRGIQLVNVALGGTLYQDIAAQHPNALKHDYFRGYPRDHLAHQVQVAELSRLVGILGETQVSVNSMHHQGIEKLAPGVRPVAHSPDELVEGLELPDYPFGLAVQWHPECLTSHEPMKALFQEFVRFAEQEN